MQSARKGYTEQSDLEALLNYFSSPEADLVAPSYDNDLDWPLSSYFVSSSHNTYLTGNVSERTDAHAVQVRNCRPKPATSGRRSCDESHLLIRLVSVAIIQRFECGGVQNCKITLLSVPVVSAKLI